MHKRDRCYADSDTCVETYANKKRRSEIASTPESDSISLYTDSELDSDMETNSSSECRLSCLSNEEGHNGYNDEDYLIPVVDIENQPLNDSSSSMCQAEKQEELRSRCINFYKHTLRMYKQNRRPLLCEHKAYEYAWAIRENMLMYGDIPPDFKRRCDIQNSRDFGTDLIDVVPCTRSAQVKCYSASTSIDYTDIAKYHTHSTLLLQCTHLLLLTTPEAGITRLAAEIIDKGKIEVRRASLDDLLTDSALQPCPLPEKSRAWRKGQKELQIKFEETTRHICRAQLPCGYGKTGAIGYILMLCMKRNEKSTHLILVPWIDLLEQTKIELEKIFDRANTKEYTITLVGNGAHMKNHEGFHIVIATHASLTSDQLRDLEYKNVFVDEAHHLSTGDLVRRNALDNIKREKTLELSATFPKHVYLDYKVSMREAIEEGVISDYVLNIIQLSSGPHAPLMNELVIDRHIDWGPTAIVFNSLERAASFKEEMELKKINVAMIHAKTSSVERSNCKRHLESGHTDIVAIVGCWNEGVDIECLRTIVFYDLRSSDINKRQIAQRASRLHPHKPFYRIVLPISLDNLDDLRIVRGFADDDPCLRSSFNNLSLSSGDSRIRIETTEKLETQACIIRERILNSVGEILENIDKIEEFIQHCAEACPSKNQEVCLYVNGKTHTFKVGVYWQSLVGRWPKLSEQDKDRLIAGCAWIPDKLKELEDLREKKAAQGGEPSEEQKITWFIQLCAGACPPFGKEEWMDHGGNPYLFKIGYYWDKLSRRWSKRSEQSQDRLIAGCAWIPDKLKELVERRQRKASQSQNVKA